MKMHSLLFNLLRALTLTACQKIEGPMEHMGKQRNDAAESVKEDVEDAEKDLEDAAADAQKAVDGDGR